MINFDSLYGRKAILVYVISSILEDVEWNIKECIDLAYSAGVQILSTVVSHCNKSINPKYFIGVGNVSNIECILKNSVASIVFFSCILSPNQEFNLSKLLKCCVIDRNQLILNIFAQRARTYAGKLQVKLAQLRYLNSRLIHEWNHLERQQGGIGIRGGPGEMQLESDRRLLNKKILKVVSNLKKIENQRENNRSHRIRIGLPTISLVGYTNAGKSTLFNVMTSSHVETSKKLFVTLDPTYRRIVNKQGLNVILVDTVGFIQNLPKDLITAFKSTLHETVQSILLLHVVDSSSKKIEQNMNIVNEILETVNICHVPSLVVMNKIDQVDKIDPHIDRDSDGLPIRVWVSAYNRSSISLLISVINELLLNTMVNYDLKIPIGNSDVNVYKELYRLQAVKQYKFENNNTVKLKVCLSYIDWNRLIKRYESLLNYVV